MNKKLITIDLDGTTLNNKAEVSSTTKKVLNQATAEGHIVSIVTGRPYRISKQIYDSLGLTTPMINFNGALAHIPHKNWDKSYEYTINRDIVFDILNSRKELGINMLAAEGKHMLLADNASQLVEGFFPQALKSNQILNQQNLQRDPTSITMFVDQDKKQLITNRLLKKYGDVIEVNTWGGPKAVLEVVSKGIQKAVGVSYLADYYGIAQKDIVAFGDESNDKEMLSYAGWGVAMQNGTPEIRGLANDVTTLNNQENGLAHYLEDYLNLAK
ncbi:haloacid dehalogenase [Dellaglioa algida]|uniref:Cof-type HAD-IIB family hydrolase n=1 Tax=Dellaglioa carnosa TaxID=2995136 RepID=UPI0011B60740|nr:Cof-type HAD-IIB family hydrolase [Dellaglioa carnosa]MCZ2492641.1 Cof-type HAD-IIB family hydrolase [Dellaglioa carnosa]TWW13772.1 haloacid dehalogenase [Dellaglioa algida]